MKPQNDIEVLRIKLDAVAETVIQLASHVTRRDNVVTCPFCQERILKTPRCPFCLEKQPPSKPPKRNEWSQKNKKTRMILAMANWKYTVDIESIWNDESTNVAEKGKLIAQVIKDTFPAAWFDADSESYDDQIDLIHQGFLSVGDDVEYFDSVMSDLYDYGDCEVAPFNKWPKNRMAWIKTSF